MVVSDSQIMREEKEKKHTETGGYPYLLNLMFSEKNTSKVMKAIKADSEFLAEKYIMDYSLLLVCEEIQPED
jgi:hypothetical protein